MKFLLIGDVHAKFDKYLDILESHEYDYSIQVGDMGVGFGYAFPEYLDGQKNKFFRGNHDNPHHCKLLSHCLGNYGSFHDIFFICGAYSIDKAQRTPGISWWIEEEMSYEELQKVIDLYEKTKPEIVLSHDCPVGATIEMGFNPFGSRTQQALNRMFEIHQPKKWFFGHYHKTWTKVIDNTEFKCLNELEPFILKIGEN